MGSHKDREFSHKFRTSSSDEREEDAGRAFFSQLRNATGVLEPDDTSDFHDKALLAIVGKIRRIEYAAL